MQAALCSLTALRTDFQALKEHLGFSPQCESTDSEWGGLIKQKVYLERLSPRFGIEHKSISTQKFGFFLGKQ